MFTLERDQDCNFRFRTNINDTIWGFTFDIGFMEVQYQDGRLINNTQPYYLPQFLRLFCLLEILGVDI